MKGSSRRTSQRLIALVSVLLLLLGLSIGACSSSRAKDSVVGPFTSGPLTFARPGQSAPPPAGDTTELAAGAIKTLGLGELHNPSGTRFRIDNVRVVNGVAGIKFVGALIYPLHQDAADVSSYAEFPPVDKLLGPSQQAVGTIVPPHTPYYGYSILIGYEATGVARATIKHFEIDYSAGTQHYTLVVPVTLAVCATPATSKSCKPEYNT